MGSFGRYCLQDATLRLGACQVTNAAGARRRLVLMMFVPLLAILLTSCSSSSSSSSKILTISPGDGTLFVGAPAAAATRRGLKVPAKPGRERPEDFSSATCGNLQYTATAIDSAGGSTDVSALVSWTSSNSAAATINNTGNAAGVALGITYIEAAMKGMSSGMVPLYVDQLNSLAISSPSTTLPIGSPTTPSTLQFTATGSFTQPNSTANNRDISDIVTWSSTAPGVATVAPGGLVTSVSQGSTLIVATVCGVSSTSNLTVGPPAPQSVLITPTTPILAVGTSQPLSAVELFSDGTTQAIPTTVTLTWSSSSAKTANVSNSTGVAFGVNPGTATITATETGGNNLVGTATVTVQVAVAPFAYVANQQGNGSGSISSYTVSATNGTLAPLASTPAQAPQQVLLSPSGSFLYTIDSGSNVHAYQVTTASTATPGTPAGALTSLDSTIPPVLAGGGQGPNIGTIDPSGQFLYVVDKAASTLYGFQIEQSQTGATPVGSLQPIQGSPFTGMGFTFNAPSWVMTDKTGQFLYVINSGDNTISGFTINLGGTLLPVASSAPLPQTGNGPVYASIDSQSHMYVANAADNTVTAYNVNPDGTWATLGVLSVPGATSVINVLVNPKTQYVYVLDKGGASGGQIFAFNLAIPPTLGTIFGTQIAPAQPVGVNPAGIAIDPTGLLLAVDNKGSNSISLFTIENGSNNTTPGELIPTTQGSATTDAGPQFVRFYIAQPKQPSQ